MGVEISNIWYVIAIRHNLALAYHMLNIGEHFKQAFSN